MTKQQPVVTTRCGQQKQTRSTPMFVFEIRHSSLECLRLPVCLLLEPLLHGSSHSPYSTALLSETQSVLLEKWGQRELAFGQGCRSHWKRELVPVWRQLVSYQEIYSAREVHNTKFFFFFPLLPLLLLLIKKNKTKNGCHIWYNTGSQRKAIVQQFLTTNTHLISSVALWKTQCMFGLFNASKKLYYWNIYVVWKICS